MVEYELNAESRFHVEKSVGLPFNQVVNMSVEDIDKHIEKKIGKKLRYQTQIGSFVSRDIYIFLKRLINL